MPWKVTDEKWLQVEADRIQEFILMPRFRHKIWTPKLLQTELNSIGLAYSLKECEALNDELHKRGVVVDVGP